MPAPTATCSNFRLWDNVSSVPSRGASTRRESAREAALPPGYGYPISGEAWAMTYMVMNHRPAADSAQIQYKVTVDDDPSLQPVRPYWLDVNNCVADPQYTVPGTGDPGPSPTGQWI